MFVVGRGLCKLCQPIVQVTDPDPHRMAPHTAATAGRPKTAPSAGFPEGAPIPDRKRSTTSATVSRHRPEAKSGSLGSALLQRELSVPTQRAARHRGVAVMPGTAAVGMLRPGLSVSPSKGVKGRGGGLAVGARNPRNPTMCRRPARWRASTR